MEQSIQNTSEYQEFVTTIKAKIRSSQYIALKAVNTELIGLYWNIGKFIVEKQDEQGWGKSIVELLSRELSQEFPGTQGFSAASLWRMRNFYLTYKDNQKLAQLVREIGWSHNLFIMERCKDSLEREYYIQMTRKFSWSRDTLASSIKNQSYERFLLNQTNFDRALPKAQAQQAKLAVKDEYTFAFLELSEEHSESELENSLINNIRKFLNEMGGYFAFLGNQYRLEVDEEEYFIDLVFYHRKLKCLVAIELKKGKFKPEYAGKMQFYLSALDDTVRLEGENPSIGIIICQDKKRTTVEYTLRDLNKPMGVATYTTADNLPKNVKELLPTPEEIAHHLNVFEEVIKE
jgi:predicted nuclease of restriction endonuclease-like (RecB) superfamily